ncbi:MAG TPA: glycosyltransferase [Cyclobacteriaceae bacterium]
MTPPLVTVICLCYNHEKFVGEALESVFNQTYPNIQLIVVDDASTDSSVDEIKKALKNNSNIPFISLTENKGNCKAFNTALSLVKGEFVIDLAADDILFPDRIKEGVDQLQKYGKEYGIHFSDAENISEDGAHMNFHSQRFPHDTIPNGDVYTDVIKRYFISPPSVMMRKEVLDGMNGYDETLAYEDFDLWVRASRNFKFTYSPKPLVRKREIHSSLGNQQFKRSGKQLKSTYLVCKKILKFNRNNMEKAALRERIIYEAAMAIKLFDVELAAKYVILLIRNELHIF